MTYSHQARGDGLPRRLDRPEGQPGQEFLEDLRVEDGRPGFLAGRPEAVEGEAEERPGRRRGGRRS
ncbi:MAG: hypothetical protein MZV64_12930 [Ignavibacteriales bacterium]|nr:hypothetical protein [Ignavibacteriales bacterium]